MTFLMKILQGLLLKHIYILLILNLTLSMQAAISHLWSYVTDKFGVR